MPNKIKILTRKDLQGKSWRDFSKGDIIKVNNFFIFINGLNTYAEKENNPFVSLKESEMPIYIRDIVF